MSTYDLIGRAEIHPEILKLRADVNEAERFAHWAAFANAYPDVLQDMLDAFGVHRASFTPEEEGMRRAGLYVAQMVAAANIDPSKLKTEISKMEGSHADNEGNDPKA